MFADWVGGCLVRQDEGDGLRILGMAYKPVVPRTGARAPILYSFLILDRSSSHVAECFPVTRND